MLHHLAEAAQLQKNLSHGNLRYKYCYLKIGICFSHFIFFAPIQKPLESMFAPEEQLRMPCREKRFLLTNNEVLEVRNSREDMHVKRSRPLSCHRLQHKNWRKDPGDPCLPHHNPLRSSSCLLQRVPALSSLTQTQLFSSSLTFSLDMKHVGEDMAYTIEHTHHF